MRKCRYHTGIEVSVHFPSVRIIICYNKMSSENLVYLLYISLRRWPDHQFSKGYRNNVRMLSFFVLEIFSVLALNLNVFLTKKK